MNPYASKFPKVKGGFSPLVGGGEGWSLTPQQALRGLGDITDTSIVTQTGQVAADVQAGLLPQSIFDVTNVPSSNNTGQWANPFVDSNGNITGFTWLVAGILGIALFQKVIKI